MGKEGRGGEGEIPSLQKEWLPGYRAGALEGCFGKMGAPEVESMLELFSAPEMFLIGPCLSVVNLGRET